MTATKPEVNLTNNKDATLESSEDKIKLLGLRTDSLMLVPLTTTTTTINYLSIALCFFSLLNSSFICNGVISFVRLAVFIVILCIVRILVLQDLTLSIETMISSEKIIVMYLKKLYL